MTASLPDIQRPSAATPIELNVTGWRDAALASSDWLAARPGLATLAESLAAQNSLTRAALQERCGELLSPNAGRSHVARAAEVSFEVFVQALALALDLRDAAKASGVPLRQWAREQRQAWKDAQQRSVAASLGAGNAATKPGEVEVLADATPDQIQSALARRMRLCAQELGPTFVKFGQLLGSASGILPPEMVDEFGRCRDAVRPADQAAVLAEVERQLGRVEDVFAHFDPVPMAAASIAQVHAATLADGSPVVVKVQRPAIRRRIERDIVVLSRLARASESVPMLGTANLSGMVELFASTVLEELDFRLEAENMVDFALALEHAGVRDVVVPAPVPGLVTPTVLVMERIEGRKLHEEAATGTPTRDTLALLRLGTQAVLEAALSYGLFHGDLHPGNLLALPDGRYGLLDFGIVGRFDATQRWALLRWLAAMTVDDLSLQVGALADLGAFPPGTDLGELTEQVEVLFAKLSLDEGAPSDEVTRNVELIVKVLTHHGMRLPKELSLFLKNLVHVSGSVRMVAPEADTYTELGGMFDFARDRYLEVVGGD